MVIVVLLIIAGQQAVAAVDSPIRQVHLGLLAFALVLAAIVSVIKLPPPPVRKPAVPRHRQIGQWMAAGGGAGSILWWRFGPWTPGADFDVTGFLYVLQNAQPLFVMGVLVAVTAGGLGLWIQNR